MKGFHGLAHNLIQAKDNDSGEWHLSAELAFLLHEKKYELIANKTIGIDLIDTERILFTKEHLIFLIDSMSKIVEEMEKFERVDQQQNDKHSKSKKGV